MCPVETFTRLFEAKLPGNIDIDCQIESAKGKRENISIIDECLFFFQDLLHHHIHRASCW